MPYSDQGGNLSENEREMEDSKQSGNDSKNQDISTPKDDKAFEKKQNFSLVFFISLIIITLLTLVGLVGGAAWSLPVDDCQETWGWFSMSFSCRETTTEYSLDEYPFPESCQSGFVGHLRSGGAFAILSFLLYLTATVLVFVNDYLGVPMGKCNHYMLGGGTFIVAFIFHTIAFCIVLGLLFATSTICSGDFAETFPGFVAVGNIPAPGSICLLLGWLGAVIALCCYLPRCIWLKSRS